MTQRFWAGLACVIAAVGSLAGSAVLLCREQGADEQKRPPFDQRLESRVAVFDTRGRPFVRAVLDLAHEYQLPLGLEYVDREGVRRPLDLKLSNKTVREILQALVAQLPQYQVKVNPGVVEVYSPKARADTANLLNTVIDNFESTDQSPRMASLGIYAALMVKLNQPCCQIGNVLDSGHPHNITLSLQKKRVYELLNTLVAQNGESLWVPVVPPQKLSIPSPRLWEVYGLGWEELVMGDLQRVFPPEK